MGSLKIINVKRISYSIAGFKIGISESKNQREASRRWGCAQVPTSKGERTPVPQIKSMLKLVMEPSQNTQVRWLPPPELDSSQQHAVSAPEYLMPSDGLPGHLYLSGRCLQRQIHTHEIIIINNK